MSRPVAGSWSSTCSPVPGSHVSTKDPSQPGAEDSVGSGAIAATVSSFRRPALRVGPRRAIGDGPLPGLRVAPDRPTREHGVDQPFLEIDRVFPRADLDRHLPGIADQVTDALVGVVAADDR